jgi:hypothetical protein
MAKTATKTPARREASREVATTGPSTGNLPAHLRGYKSEGAGVPTEAKDFLLPMAKVLDAKSPEVEKRGANYVKGAEAGDILIKNAPVPLIKGEVGFPFQLCYRDEAIVEWIPRGKGGGGGSGYVGRLPIDFMTKNPRDVEMRPHPENKQKLVPYRKSSGNMLVETKYYGGFMLPEEDGEDFEPMPLVLPFASSGHTVAKRWNMMLASKRINGTRADIWLCVYRIKTALRQRGEQAWYLFDPSDAGEGGETLWVATAADVVRGKALHESIATGTKQFAPDEAPADESADDRM